MQGYAPNSPRVAITVADQPLDEALSGAVTLVLVRMALGVPSVAELCIAQDAIDLDWSGDIGASVAIDLLIDGERVRFFEGRIARLRQVQQSDGSTELSVRAYDALEALRQRSQIRRFENVSIDDIAADLAAEAGLAFESDTVSSAARTEVQRGESDLEFLVRIAARVGLYPVVMDGALRLMSLQGGDAPPVECRLGRNLLEADCRVSAERSAVSVAVGAWDHATVRDQNATATRAAVAGAREHVVTDRAVADSADAGHFGDAVLQQAGARERTLSGLASGDVRLRPGASISLVGAGLRFDGRYVLSSTLHRFDNQGYTVEIDTHPPKLSAPSVAAVVTPGEVLTTDDPDGQGRCRVALSGYLGVESGWLQPVIAGAGRRKGMVALPENGDQVLAVFPDGDLASGFVLGGVFAGASLPSGMRRSARRPTVLRTDSGQSLELSDREATARIKTRAGSLLEFEPDAARLAATSDLVIEAPGKRIVIRAKRVDFEKKE